MKRIENTEKAHDEAKARDERRERRVFRLSERNVNVAPTVSTAPTEDRTSVQSIKRYKTL